MAKTSGGVRRNNKKNLVVVVANRTPLKLTQKELLSKASEFVKQYNWNKLTIKNGKNHPEAYRILQKFMDELSSFYI